jgi:5'-deoxynucleotidase YfbR-like HD superfamily hydrolase
VNINSLGVLLASGNVTRCHTLPTIKPQTVGAHTWRTLVILHWLYAPGHPPSGLTHALLVHDMPEILTGDMPGNTKHAHPALKNALDKIEKQFLAEQGIEEPKLNSVSEDILNLCDSADLVMYALDEIDMGNINMVPVAIKARKMMYEHLSSLEQSSATTERMEILVRGITERVEQIEEDKWPNW